MVVPEGTTHKGRILTLDILADFASPRARCEPAVTMELESVVSQGVQAVLERPKVDRVQIVAYPPTIEC
jgi:hypothetical protein